MSLEIIKGMDECIPVYPELSSLFGGGMFFLFIASTIKEGTAIAKPIQPYNKGIT
jgi:hypothetical protein